jgi:hypothetical protein
MEFIFHNFYVYVTGADPGFQVRGRGAQLNNLRRAEGGAKFVGVFRVKNHDFTPNNHIFSNFRGGAPGAPLPPWIRPCVTLEIAVCIQTINNSTKLLSHGILKNCLILSFKMFS